MLLALHHQKPELITNLRLVKWATWMKRALSEFATEQPAVYLYTIGTFFTKTFCLCV